ncbi:hypothetical protein GPECTOR_39g441 [Gonium pectorale]|uniref:Amino acid permease/ SLC12A domain-containing protein n=1 Tax=Gonium pectorale TaxID=33097 RepID=A0A150GAS5_GONPE|nr:hypothetical protein GPECTOR_39g441 [Gonium pectorale]|eukprot:KXZ46947.1 hypothetical protein GPECTOR_39g441 [Gonium pectorale]
MRDDPLTAAIVSGGPAVCVWAWLGVSALNTITSLCLAEMASCMPAAIGSLYVFTARLAPCAYMQHMSSMSAGGYDAVLDPGYDLTPAQLFGCYCAVLLSWLVLVSAPLRVTSVFITAASLWQVLGGGALFASLLALTPRRHSIGYVLAGRISVPRASRVRSGPYNVLEGLLFPITAQTGYETVLYFVEEMFVHRRRRRGRLRAAAASGGGLAASCALTLLFLLLLLAAAPSLQYAVDSRNETRGQDPMAQVVYDILKAAYGSGRGAPGLIAVLAVGVYGTGLVVAAGTARKLWAMAADGFVPNWVGGGTTTASGGGAASINGPARAAALVTAAALAPGLLLLLPARRSRGGGAATGDTALEGALSFVAVAVNGSYLLPVFLRLMPGSAGEGYDAGARRVGLGGGFTLGRASRPLFAVAAVWTCVSTLLPLLQPAWPPRPATANWAPVSSALLAAAVALSWFAPRVGARSWFRGLASVGGVSFC